jgi:chromosome segregation ATPase
MESFPLGRRRQGDIHDTRDMAGSSAPQKSDPTAFAPRKALPADKLGAPGKLQLVHPPATSALAGDLDVLHQKLSSALGLSQRPALTAAINLLSRANTALDVLDKRNSEIESWALEAIQRLQADLAAANATIGHCRDRIAQAEELENSLNLKLSSVERRALHAEERANQAEQELVKERARAESAETRAARAEADASNAERWLSQISDLINDNLSGAAAVLENLEKTHDPLAELKKKLDSL